MRITIITGIILNLYNSKSSYSKSNKLKPNVDFCGEGETGVSGLKPFRAE